MAKIVAGDRLKHTIKALEDDQAVNKELVKKQFDHVARKHETGQYRQK